MLKDPLDMELGNDDMDKVAGIPVVPLDVYTAASIGNCASISEALEMNPECLHACNKGGWTALMYAAHYGHHEAVLLLHSRGASVHTKTGEGCTALMLAAGCGQTMTVKVLLECGSLLEARDKQSWTAVFHAVQSRHPAVLELLLTSGANAMACEPQKGETALQFGIRANDLDLVQLLLKYGADPTVPDHCGETPFCLASRLKHKTVADTIAQAVATRGIAASLSPITAGRDFWQGDVCEGGASFEQLLTQAGLGEYMALFEEQAVDLLVFLSLTDADLKECGVSKLGPRRKMTSLIARWHRNAPMRSCREAAYADKLLVELQELQLKHAQLVRDNTKLAKELYQEQELRSSTESLVVEARARLHECHKYCLLASRQLQGIYDTIVCAAHDCGPCHCKCNRSVSSNGEPRVVDGNYCHVNGDEFHVYKDHIPIQGNPQLKRDLIIRSQTKKDYDDQMRVLDLLPNDNIAHACKANAVMNSNDLKTIGCLLTPNQNLSNNVDNVNAFNPETQFFNDINYLYDENQRNLKYYDQIQINNLESVPEVVPDSSKAFIPTDYRIRPPSLCLPKLGSPVQYCLKLVQRLVSLSDPNIPRDIGPAAQPRDRDGASVCALSTGSQGTTTSRDLCSQKSCCSSTKEEFGHINQKQCPSVECSRAPDFLTGNARIESNIDRDCKVISDTPENCTHQTPEETLRTQTAPHSNSDIVHSDLAYVESHELLERNEFDDALLCKQLEQFSILNSFRQSRLS
ncbi:uncharacterized protein LOC108672450 [Hyalella azteca]|uniref:Uncharacterized protein LOC108672450 n=1 Tax=Hyalella azteca TaxID=294128 RepID=A0A8B7NPG1_HYAAZ|nr:uncharacterized protein LOC108672450 [Hyalella azteca]